MWLWWINKKWARLSLSRRNRIKSLLFIFSHLIFNFFFISSPSLFISFPFLLFTPLKSSFLLYLLFLLLSYFIHLFLSFLFSSFTFFYFLFFPPLLFWYFFCFLKFFSSSFLLFLSNLSTFISFLFPSLFNLCSFVQLLFFTFSLSFYSPSGFFFHIFSLLFLWLLHYLSPF